MQEPGFDPPGRHRHQRRVWTALAASTIAPASIAANARERAAARPTQRVGGWTLYQKGPKLGTDIRRTPLFQLGDRANILGRGENTPLATGSNSDSLLVLDPNTQQWLTLRVPYPLGFYSRGLDGRIDDARAGWKGRALYANYGTHFVWHIEGGKGTKGKLVKFQLRPDPLAR